MHRCLFLTTLLFALLSWLPAQEASAQLRGVRYCEVIAAYLVEGEIVADVWNSLSAGDPCLLAEWEALDPVAIQQDLGALVIALNGPRFWTLDFITSTSTQDGPIRQFGGISMRLAATVRPGGTLGLSPYTPNSVSRDTQFIFRKGQEVYELIAPTTPSM